MGFFETYEAETGGGSSWVGADEKADLIAERTPFTVTAITFEEGDKFGDRYVLDIILDGTERRIGFGVGAVESRDKLLANMAQYLAAGADGVEVALEPAGRAVLIVQA